MSFEPHNAQSYPYTGDTHGYEIDYRTRTPRRTTYAYYPRSASPKPTYRARSNSHYGTVYDKSMEPYDHAYVPNDASAYAPASSWAVEGVPFHQPSGPVTGVHGRTADSHTNVLDKPPAPAAPISKAVNPSFHSRRGIPIKGAATTDFIKATLPKNFAQPLTCFYWFNNGRCTKSDEECIYAHHYTGVVASAPVAFNGGKVPSIAGRNAMYQVKQETAREKDLDDLEARLRNREIDLDKRFADVRRREAELWKKEERFQKFDGLVKDIRKHLEDTDKKVDQIQQLLDACRKSLALQTTASPGETVDDRFAELAKALSGAFSGIALMVSTLAE